MKVELLYELKINTSFLMNVLIMIFCFILLIGLAANITRLIKTGSYKKIDMVLWCVVFVVIGGVAVFQICENILYVQKYKEYTQLLGNGDYQTVEGVITEYDEDPDEDVYASFQVENVVFEYSVAEPIIGYNGSCKKIGLANDQFVKIKYIDDLENRIILSIERIGQ